SGGMLLPAGKHPSRRRTAHRRYANETAGVAAAAGALVYSVHPRPLSAAEQPAAADFFPQQSRPVATVLLAQRRPAVFLLSRSKGRIAAPAMARHHGRPAKFALAAAAAAFSAPARPALATPERPQPGTQNSAVGTAPQTAKL